MRARLQAARTSGTARRRLLPWLLVALVATWAACARPPTVPAPAAPAPIDLSPRCEPMLEPLAPSTPLPAPLEPRIRLETLPRAARWLSVAAPTAPLDTLVWGFETRADDSRLAAALLQSGEASAEAQALREALLGLGASLRAEIEGDRLWLELRSPPARRDAALALLGRWLEVEPPAQEAFERIRRAVAIAALTEQASATLQAERLFRQLHPPDESGSAFEHEAVPDPAEPTPTGIAASLRALLRPEGSIVLHVTPDGDDAERVVQAGIEGWIARQPGAAGQDAGPESDAGVAGAGAEPQTTPGAHALPGPHEAGTLHAIDRPNSPQVELLVGFPTVPAGHADARALDMLASLIGSDVGGRLFRDLRERQGLAYIIKATHEPEGRFVISTRARPERVAALLAGIEAHLEALVDVPLLPCEVRMLVDRMTGETALLADDPTRLARRWRSELARTGEIEPLSAGVASYRAAAERGLDAVARRYLTGPPTIVLVGDAKALRRDLDRAFPGRPIRIYDGELQRAR